MNSKQVALQVCLIACKMMSLSLTFSFSRALEQLGEYGEGNMQITKTPTSNKKCVMKKWRWK
jgi:hypothetical protein